jgi:hypothetical protein
VLVVLPGVLVMVHVPDDGNPPKSMLLVARVQVGSVIVPTIGAEGVGGCEFITTLPEAEDMQPEAFVTVKVYIPAASPDTDVLVPVPVLVVPPGVLVNVHVPVAGNPFKTTLLAAEHVG